jgi:hypothetical protein
MSHQKELKDAEARLCAQSSKAFGAAGNFF